MVCFNPLMGQFLFYKPLTLSLKNLIMSQGSVY